MDRLEAALDRETAASELDVALEKIAQLELAMHTNRTISLAIGLMMARRDCSREEAFTLLAGASQRSNLKLREIAARLVAAHEGQLGEQRPPESAPSPAVVEAPSV